MTRTSARQVFEFRRGPSGIPAIVRACVVALAPAATGCIATRPAVAPASVRASASASAGIVLASDVATAQPQSSGAAGSTAGDNEAEALAKQLANPVAALISVPLQLNYDEDVGPSDGERWTLNVQPVVPISLDETWNVISRTIVPLISQDDIPAGDDESGLGDVTQSLFFSPKAPTESGWIWGAGPAFLIPTASDETLGTEKWGVGPTAVFLKQAGPWTYGALLNHIWSVAGDDDRSDVSSTFLQPFVSHTTHTGTSFTLNAESTYDWEADELALPLNAVVSKVVKLGGQRVSIGGGLRYWVEDSDASPEGWGFRFFITFLFPK